MSKADDEKKRHIAEGDYMYVCPACGKEDWISRMKEFRRISKSTGEIVVYELPLCSLNCFKALEDNIYACP